MIRAAIALLVAVFIVTACAIGPRAPRNTSSDDRAADAVKRMQDEFNAIFPDA